jgi:hypothetical protein
MPCAINSFLWSGFTVEARLTASCHPRRATEMLSLVRGIAITFVVAGLFVAVHPQKAPTAVLKASIPVPVCPPNDPDACHIDQWPQ